MILDCLLVLFYYGLVWKFTVLEVHCSNSNEEAPFTNNNGTKGREKEVDPTSHLSAILLLVRANNTLEPPSRNGLNLSTVS